MKKAISTGYQPRDFIRAEGLHQKMKRFNVIVAHRGFGKTIFCQNEQFDKAMRNQNPNPFYVYLAPNYGSAKRVAWENLKNIIKDIPGATVNESDLRVDIPRPWLKDKVRFLLLGAENPGSLRGIHIDGAILDEFSEMDPSAWTQIIRPALAIKKGWVIFIGTPKGTNTFYDIYMKALSDPENWYCGLYKASETGIVPESELELARQTMSEPDYEQEYECSFLAANVGSYYGKIIEQAEKDKRITNVPYDPAVPVITSWDLGIGDTTAIWFLQQVGKEHHAIDYYEMSGKGLDHFVKILKEKDYLYEEHLLPHDAAAKELGTGKTRQETLRTLGLKNSRIIKRQTIDDGISAARMLLPKVWFDKVKCARGLEALKNYQKKWDSKNNIFSDTPLHNWASNGADSFRYYALGYRDLTRSRQELPNTSKYQFDIFEQSEESLF